ncbi:MAG: sensor histidine kinase [Pedobacter sp.]|nr:MAG: sensor histidine kinase [Pedobacter sp.]
MEEFFRVSSGLKNLIGSDLITDYFVAVFELVKNSFDARATTVEIIFENIYSENPKIIIKDNGKGMSYSDLTQKWLFVAYSAKRDNTEDKDYRDNLSLGRHYAGAKGVGRFSCDRLGQYLTLSTKTASKQSSAEQIKVDWSKFELDQNKEFSKIPVDHEHIKKLPYSLQNGTVLEITGIDYEFWNRDNFKKLKEKLSKLIRPDLNDSQGLQDFKIILSVPEELDEDLAILQKKKTEEEAEMQLYYNTVNGEIKNFVFRELNIKTTKINSYINDDGIIVTTLTDRENFIYEIKEKNRFPKLKGISITLYFLNRSAKIIFKKRTGVEHVNYGSLFVYKNGFRVYPFGERRDDSLGLENRALQGYARYIGLRSLIGEISIEGDNPELRETTSRGDGLVKNATYEELAGTENGFLITTLRRLEKYAVEVTNWGINDDDIDSLEDHDVKEKLVKLITNITDDKSVINLRYNEEIINIIFQQEENSAKKLLRNFKRIADESGDENLFRDAERLQKAVTDSLAMVKSAELERDKAVDTKDRLNTELEIEKNRNIYLTATRKTLSPDAEDLIHGISFTMKEVNHILVEILGLLKYEHINPETLREKVINAKTFAERAIKVSELVTRANFRHDVEEQFINVPDYIREYLSIYNNLTNKSNLKINVINHGAVFKKSISLIDISLILDNLISNAIKWKRGEETLIKVEMVSVDAKTLEVIFQDDGLGVMEKFLPIIDKIFELGVTETAGSGIGLHTVKNILKKNKGSIEFLGNGIDLTGAAFKLTLNK